MDFTIFANKKVVEIDAKHNIFRPHDMLEFFNKHGIPLDFRIRFTDLTFKNIHTYLMRSHFIMEVEKREQD